jgi:hypothetical protein
MLLFSPFDPYIDVYAAVDMLVDKSWSANGFLVCFGLC